jgi:protein-tyrosine phosphatase
LSVRVLFVCLGNICRSPTAEVVFRDRLARAGLDDRVQVDSAGTGDWHIGKAPDRRAQEAAAGRGYVMYALRARQVGPDDFHDFDYLIAMDAANLADLEMLRWGNAAAEARLLLDFHPQAAGQDVPDPYYGGDQGFARVLDLVEAAAEGLLDHLRDRHGL